MAGGFQKPRFDPRSPVQPGPSTAPYLFVAVMAAFAIWTAMRIWSQDSKPRPPQQLWVVSDHSTTTPSQPPISVKSVSTDQATIAERMAVAKLRTLFQSDDYPQFALRNNEQGTAQARLYIDLSGRPTKCTIIRGATPTLNYATCSILLKRARFTPALDSRGHPMTAVITSPPITWRLEG